MMMKYETHLNSHILNTKSLPVCPISTAIEGLRERTEYLDILFFCPSLNGVLFSMFCLLVEGECQILLF